VLSIHATKTNNAHIAKTVDTFIFRYFPDVAYGLNW